MRYAILSDIHGNLLALEAVLCDAKRQRVDGYLFAGDYYADFPYPNEVVRAMRGLPNAYAVRGNKEDYLIALAKQDQSKWSDEQMAPLYWNFRALTDENLAYLTGLPVDLSVPSITGSIEMFHKANHRFRDTFMMQLGSARYAKKMAELPFSHAQYLNYVSHMAANDARLHEIIRAQSPCAYIFGHSHTQWYARVGDSILINPGSCGMPLDFDTTAPYDILECAEGHFGIEECRVSFDRERAVRELISSELNELAPGWCELIVEELVTARECVSFFLKLAEQTAKQMNSDIRPYENRVWRHATERWRAGERVAE